LQEAERGVVVAYAEALAARHRGELEAVLAAAAACPADPFGVFDPEDARAMLGETSTGVIDRLERLTRPEGGGVLVGVAEPGRTRFRFQNQMMPQYVLMRQAIEAGRL
jgi:hypothetical protein